MFCVDYRAAHNSDAKESLAVAVRCPHCAARTRTVLPAGTVVFATRAVGAPSVFDRSRGAKYTSR
jgi:hypothetical protein